MGEVQKRSAGRKPCRKPKGKHGAVRTTGCINHWCRNGAWISSVSSKMCCYDGKPAQLNTTLATMKTMSGEVRLECRLEEDKARMVMVDYSTCPDFATQIQVNNQTMLLEERADSVEEKINNLEVNIDKKIEQLELKVEEMLKEQSELLKTHMLNTDDYCPPVDSTHRQPSSTEPSEQPITGILIAGGSSTELFLPSTGKSCSLAPLPAPSWFYHTLDSFPNNSAVMCGGWNTRRSCLIFNQNSSSGTWDQFATTIYERERHTSWMTPEGLLLVGGPPSQAPAEVIHSDKTIPNYLVSPWMACAINFENYTIITGGFYTRRSVKQLDVEENIENLPTLLEERFLHGCGYYHDGDVRILVVAGGGDPPLQSTELLRDGAASWVFGSKLPRTIKSMGSVSVDNKILLFGGYDNSQGKGKARSELLSYNGSSWVHVGNLTTPRSGHAGTVIKIDPSGPLDISACF